MRGRCGGRPVSDADLAESGLETARATSGMAPDRALTGSLDGTGRAEKPTGFPKHKPIGFTVQVPLQPDLCRVVKVFMVSPG